MNTLSQESTADFSAFVAAQFELYQVATDPRWENLNGLWDTEETDNIIPFSRCRDCSIAEHGICHVCALLIAESTIGGLGI